MSETTSIRAESKATSSPVRVCVISPNFYRSSGVTVAIRTIYAATRELNIEQCFVDCRYGNVDEDTSWLPAESTAFFRLMSGNPIVVINQVRSLASWLRRKRVSVVHVHHRRLAALLGACRALLRCRIVYTGHLTYPFAAWFWSVRPDRATAVSASVASNMRATMRVRDVQVVSNPVRFPAMLPRGTAGVDAICIGRLEPVKGHKYLIQAWKLLRDEGYRAKLALVGEGSLEEPLREQVRINNLDDLIEFRGFRTDVVSEIGRARFAVLASRVEGQAFAVIEAAAYGKASLVTDVDGSRDCLPPNRTLPNGVAFADAAILASALKVWLANPETVMKEGEIFRKFLRQMSSPEAVGEQYAKIYREIGLQLGPT